MPPFIAKQRNTVCRWSNSGEKSASFCFFVKGGCCHSKLQMGFCFKFQRFTGVPYTTLYRPSENPLNLGSIENLPADYLASRTKAGHHLDIRIDRYFNFSNWTLIMYVGIQNVYNHKIPTQPRYDFGADEIRDSNDFRILPSSGINLQFYKPLQPIEIHPSHIRHLANFHIT